MIWTGLVQSLVKLRSLKRRLYPALEKRDGGFHIGSRLVDGEGVFVKKGYVIEADQFICAFTGKKMNASEMNSGAYRGYRESMRFIPIQEFDDCAHDVFMIDYVCFAGFVNTAADPQFANITATTDNDQHAQPQVNCTMIYDHYNERWEIHSTKRIIGPTQLFADYSEDKESKQKRKSSKSLKSNRRKKTKCVK